ncbi:MAG: diguanylate cyclase [Planctomycetaceae bacterium]
MNSKRFDELKQTGSLPSPTGVGMEILRLTRNDCASIEEIARVIQTDPALTGRTLKYANTGNAASNRPITTIRDAVVRIGVRAVSGIALGFSVVSTCRTAACAQFDCRRYWSHSLAIGLGAQSIAQRLRAVSPDEGFLCGLLGQVGRLALASVHPEKYSEVLINWGGRSPSELIHLEQAAFATDHNELSGALLNDWGLPEFFATAVLHHEAPDDCDLPEEGKERQLSRVLYAAIRLADICVADDDHRAASLVPEFLRRMDRLGIDSDEVIDIVDATIAQWQEWGRILNVGTWPVSSFAELLATSWELEAQQEVQSTELADPVEASESAIPSMTASAVGAPQAARKGLRILVADDDPVTLRVLTKLLSSSGHDVCATSNGRDALRVALETNPQLVITDWMMPETSGVELCRSLRSTRFGRQVYIIVLTSQSDESHLVEAFEAGADDFVVKPFQAKPLFARIRAGLRVIKLQEELARDKERIDKMTAELAIANRRLELDALTDVLTGLPNRRYLVERLSHDWAMARRSGQPLTCMVLDIDHFKRINDTFGHDVGDRVLERVAEILKTCIRGTDVVCRYGGEEFVVVGADSDLESSMKCAERLRHAVETEATAAFPQLERPITVSIGVALRNESTRTPEMLLKAADEALYMAKQSGRNRVCTAASLGDDGAAPMQALKPIAAGRGVVAP